jgi:hypothetical protein
MKNPNRFLWVTGGFVAGLLGAGLYFGQARPVMAATSDRFEDFIMCTGSVAVAPRAQTDGVWILDYRKGKLLGTVIDRLLGKIVGWAEVDLTSEFGLAPNQNVHFLMTTGQIAYNQAALYVAETTTGKLAVYTMGPRLDGQPGVGIRRHDMVLFRQASPKDTNVGLPGTGG